MSGDRPNPRGPIQPTLFPTYQPFDPVQFRDAGGIPSGVAGARAKLVTSLNNAPQILYRLTFQVSYELPAEFFATHPEFKKWMREGGIDDDFTVDIKLTQQNPTQGPVHVRDLQGFLSINQHPLAVPFAFQGGNNITVDVQRLTGYPVIDDVEIVPTVRATLVLGMFVSDTGGSPWRPAP
jgi:hypothetical protein